MADHLLTSGWETAPLTVAEHALCVYAEKLTQSPGSMQESDVISLRAAGWSDVQIQDACQVVAYFNYVNRLADGLGVDLEAEMKAPQR